MKKYFKFLLLLTLAFFYNCEPDDESKLSNYVGFELSPANIVVDENSTATLDIKVYASEVKSSDRTYAIEVDTDPLNTTLTTAYSVPATVTIPANTNEGVFTVSITDDETLSFDDAVAQILSIRLVDTVGVDNSGNFDINVIESCPNIYVTLDIITDDYPDETTWAIYDLNSGTTLIYEGGPYDGETNTTLSFEYCLLAGNYGVVVYDSYGDGGSAYTVYSGSTVFVDTTTLTGTQSSAVFTVD